MDKTPAMLGHCQTVYAAMEAGATELDDSEHKVYHGKLTQLFEELGLPVPYYTFVMRELKLMDCVRQLKRGGGRGGGGSEWLLLRPPTEELWEQFEAERGNTKPTMEDVLTQRVIDLTRRLNEHERRIKQLEEVVYGANHV